MAIEVIVGARVSVEGRFRLAGVLTDPLAVTCTVRSPSSDLQTYSYPTDITQEEPGVYRCEFSTPEDGTWWARFEGSGVVEGVNEVPITVRPSSVL